MSAANFSSAMGPVRDTYGFDRADKFLMPQGQSRDFGAAGPVPSAPAAGQSQAQGYPAAPANPYRAQGAETNARNRAGTYAGSSFEDWYKNLGDQERAQFSGPVNPNAKLTGFGKTVSSPQDPEVVREANARAHYMTNILPKDPKYQQLQGGSNDATDARTAGMSVQDYQRDRAGATGATNTANAVASDAAARSSVAQGQAATLNAQGRNLDAQSTLLYPAQARGMDASANATNTDAGILGAQWNAMKTLYPSQVSAQIRHANAAAGYDDARADATRAQGTAAAVTAYGAANRAVSDKDGNLLAPTMAYGAPAAGSAIPTMTPAPQSQQHKLPLTPGMPSADDSAGYKYDPKTNTATDLKSGVRTEYREDPKYGFVDDETGRQINAGPDTPLAPPSLLKRAHAATDAMNSAVASPWTALGPPAMAANAIYAGAKAFSNPRGTTPAAPSAAAPAAKTMTVNGVNLTQQVDGSFQGSNGRKYKVGPDGKFVLVG